MHFPKIEQSSPKEIAAFQDQKLVELLDYLSKYSKFYQEKAQRAGIPLKSIRTVGDLQKFPYTTKDDLQRQNADFLCVPKERIIDYVTTSGTSGDPVLFGLTDKDLDRLAYNESLSFQSMDLVSGNLIQLTTTLDRRFMAGLAYFLGARKAGMGVVRVGSGVPEMQWDTIFKLNPTALVAVPSFLLKMLEFAKNSGIDYKSCSVKKILCIGEPIRQADFTPNALSKRILDKWDVQLYSTFASTEMATAFTECKEGRGGHLHPELIIAEFVDEMGQPVASGEPGELVITTLGIESMPLLRFRTGDIVQAFREPCGCGRTTPRLGPVLGRKQQMIKYKGTTLYPPALFDLLDDFEEVENYIVEISSDDLGGDEILVKIGSANWEESETEVQEALLAKVRDRFRAKLRVSPKIVFENVDAIQALKFPPEARKAVQLLDKRQ